MTKRAKVEHRVTDEERVALEAWTEHHGQTLDGLRAAWATGNYRHLEVGYRAVLQRMRNRDGGSEALRAYAAEVA